MDGKLMHTDEELLELMTETFVICKTCRPTIVNGRLSIVHNHDEDCAMFLVPTES